MSGPPFTVIAFGTGWMVVDKPSGISVHNDPGGDLCSLLTGYLGRAAEDHAAVGLDPGFGLHPVHRLDKETSGVIVLACTREAFKALSATFSSNGVTKHYLALVHGVGFKTGDEGIWKWPLTPRSAGRRNIQGRGSRSTCSTEYRVLKRSRHYTMVDCRLITGRTHQIRRHAALAGHPLLGDRRYGSLRACRYLEDNCGFTRLALHASTISLRPPGADDVQQFESSRLPVEMERIFMADTWQQPASDQGLPTKTHR